MKGNKRTEEAYQVVKSYVDNIIRLKNVNKLELTREEINMVISKLSKYINNLKDIDGKLKHGVLNALSYNFLLSNTVFKPDEKKDVV